VSNHSYQLVNAIELNRRYPETFEIPSLDERQSLSHGDFAKIIFLREANGRKEERMWVEVLELQSDGTYIGRLDNVPSLFSNLKLNDRVAFGPENICDIDTGNKPTPWNPTQKGISAN
jgi:hypothetical protein